MMPFFRADFIYTDTLDEILQSERLCHEKYSYPNCREAKFVISKIATTPLDVFTATASFLQLLRDKYGNVQFGEALDLWRADRKKTDK